jgi:hypothetical protein
MLPSIRSGPCASHALTPNLAGEEHESLLIPIGSTLKLNSLKYFSGAIALQRISAVGYPNS